LIGINPGAPLGGGTNVYFVGNFDGTSFQADDASVRVMDFGKDYYAVQTFNSARDGEAIAIGWASNWQYTQVVPTFPWRGAFSIPRVLSLRKNGTETAALLLQKPISLDNLRDKTLYEGSAHLGAAPLSISLQGNASFEFKATLILQRNRDEGRPIVTIDILNAAREKVVIRYDWLEGRIFVNRGEALGFRDPSFSPSFETTCVDTGNSIRLQVLVDYSMLEVFVNDGCHVCTIAFYMKDGPPTEMSWHAENCSVGAENLQAHTLKSIWE
jgi:beta-fructofuranosidase